MVEAQFNGGGSLQPAGGAGELLLSVVSGLVVLTSWAKAADTMKHEMPNITKGRNLFGEKREGQINSKIATAIFILLQGVTTRYQAGFGPAD